MAKLINFSTKFHSEMYLVVNADLGMGKGKIAAQVGHVVQLLTEKMLTEEMPSEKMLGEMSSSSGWLLVYDEWKRHGIKKIVLKATEKQLLELIADHPDCVYIRDAGLTQIAPGSLTVVGFPPQLKYGPILSKFKLL